jgi:putative NADPH-quinone reductase
VKINIIIAHPTLNSFNHAIAETAANKLRENGHEVIYHDLYRENFDPILGSREITRNADIPGTIDKYCSEIAEVEGIVIVHPNWWGQPPAILKGWVDRVMRPGVAYEFEEGDSGEGIPVGLLKANTALIFNTSNTPPEREQAVFQDPLDTLWKNCVFGLCGVSNIYRKNYGIIITSTLEQRQSWLEDVATIIDNYFPAGN